jgi:preprotein translocase subunit Sss1
MGDSIVTGKPGKVSVCEGFFPRAWIGKTGSGFRSRGWQIGKVCEYEAVEKSGLPPGLETKSTFAGKVMSFIQQLRWRPEIGDPSLMGWLTVAAYAVVAVVAGVAAFRAGRNLEAGRSSRRIWTLVAVLMALLCINKQLDLQSLVTDIGRVLSRRQGWYESRRDFQKWLVIAVLGLSAIGTLGFAVLFRVFLSKHLLLAAGVAMLMTFIVTRAVSFHHVDQLLKVEMAGLRINWILELGGIAVIGWAAAREAFSSRSSDKARSLLRR